MEWKDTLIVLISKVKNPLVPSNYRPISLCHTNYKIVAAMLVNRLKKCISKMISEEQMAFIPGRSISEHCLLVQEVFHKFKFSKNKKGLIAIKLDMEQVYDNIGWPTLCQILKWYGFPTLFTILLMDCVVNGKTISALSFENLMKCKYSGDDDGYGNWLKKLKLNKMVEIFWWQLSKSAIPTNHFLKYRRISSIDLYARGYQLVEDYEHIMVQCKYLVDTIVKMHDWGIHIPIFQSLDCCLQKLRSLTGQNYGIVKIYCTIVHLNWKNRNDVKYGKVALPSSLVAANVLSLAMYKSIPYLDCWGTNLLWESTKAWCPPPLDWIKINVDASLLSSNIAGIGGVFRDHKGRLILAFGKKKIHWDIAQFELEAVITVRDFIRRWMLDCKGVIIESDNINIVTFFQDSLKKKFWYVDRWPVKELFFLDDFNKVVFLHALISCNKDQHNELFIKEIM
ncbi:hypothetical protein KFK09_008663 [Dendrobium nobile]|uniref:Reverse transcriptase domain-containing protein n=1 Tax=Dendrobium nobile TaxID=94219 RepID=A0A8T3BPK7_DENNO|nr:hypothetical protein KFK09_008663 [Dendrobium nobile]